MTTATATTTLPDHLPSFFAGMADHLSPGSHTKARWAAKAFANRLADTPVTELTSEELQDALAHLGTGGAPTTDRGVRTCRPLLRRFLAHVSAETGVDLDLRASRQWAPPVVNVDAVDLNAYLTVEAPDYHPLRTLQMQLVTHLAMAGLTASEMVDLTIQDLTTETIAVSNVNDAPRQVPTPPAVAKMLPDLAAQLEDHTAEVAKAMSQVATDQDAPAADVVFVRVKKNARYRPGVENADTLAKALRLTQTDAGLEPMNITQLRGLVTRRS